MTDLQKAYRLVLNDMVNSGCGLVVGKYDAEHGSEKYMYGVNTVMEWIAYRVSDEVGDAFSDMFTKNMLESEEKCGRPQ